MSPALQRLIHLFGYSITAPDRLLIFIDIGNGTPIERNRHGTQPIHFTTTRDEWRHCLRFYLSKYDLISHMHAEWQIEIRKHIDIYTALIF